MAEYIKRANLAERIKYYITHTPEDSGEHYALSIALNEVLNCPTADVVSVVRCKDCKYAYINPSGAILCSSSMQMKKQDGFCDYGDINDGGVDIEID